MSEPKKGSGKAREPVKHNETASVDWAEKLKASMDRPHDETTAEAPEYDDLAALLREQLSKSEQSTDPELTPPRRTEDTEAVDDCAEPTENPKENFEEYPESTSSEENLSSEQSCDEVHESSDSMVVIPNVEKNEFDGDCAIDEDYSALQNSPSEDGEWDDEWEEHDREEEDYDSLYDLYSSDTRLNENITKEILDRAFGEEFIENPLPRLKEEMQPAVSPLLRHTPSSVPPVAYHQPSVDAWTDDRLNGVSTPVGIGSHHLRDLAQENQKLITESETSFGETDSETPLPIIEEVFPHVPDVSTAENGVLPEPDSLHHTAPIRSHIPLQLGLDDISPTVHRAEATPLGHTERPTRTIYPQEEEPSDYTARMAHNREEETALGDTELFMRLGYEEELRRTDEKSRLEQLHVEADTRCFELPTEIPTVRVDREYSGREDTDSVEKAYNRSHRKNRARLTIAAVGVLVGLFYDLAPTFLDWFGESLDAALGTSLGEVALDQIPYYFPVGLAWTLLICLPFLSRLGRGLRSLLNFEPTRYAVAALALVASLGGGMVAWLVGDPRELPLFCGSALLMLLLASLSELVLTEGEYYGFSVISTGKTACILTDDPTSASISLEEKNKRDERFRGEQRNRIFTVVRTGRVADYFARTGRYNPYMGRLNYLLPVALLVAIVSVGLSLALGGDILTDGVRVFLASYLICLPSAFVLSLTLPLRTANAHLRKKGAAIIGSAAPADYEVKGTAHLIYTDGDALKALHRMNITLRGDPRSEEYRHVANVVFRLLNTPLADDPVLHEEKLDHYRIEISERGEQYLRLYLVDTQKGSATEIMMGSHHALTHRGVRLPRVSMEKQYKKGEGCQVMYLAFNRNFHLAYSVEYRVGRTFGHMVSALNEMGYRVDIATYDPMFDPSMDGLTRLRKQNPVEVIYPENFDAIRKARSGGIVVTGRSLDLQYPLAACRSMLAAYRRGYLCSWLCLPVGIAAVVPGICLGLTGLLSSALIALWQIICTGITLWVTLATTRAGLVGGENRKVRDKKASKSSKNK